MNWRNFEFEKPVIDKIGDEFLVAIETSSGIDYEVAEWYLFDEDEPYFLIERRWCGQHMINRRVIYWCEIGELPQNFK